MSFIRESLQQAVDRFIEEVIASVRKTTLAEIAHALGEEPGSLGMPHRKAKRLRAAKKRPAPKELPKQLATALHKIKTSKRPVTSAVLAKTLGTPEGYARQVLSKLLRRKLITTKSLGDGTRRKVYLLTKH